ncbi:MAG: hypothetical protein KA116_00575 [Proteobacteria bacterium]|nr:hypothetical protein [Pseudomonadota bacterium]
MKKNKLTQSKSEKEAIVSSWMRIQSKYFSTIMLNYYEPTASYYDASSSLTAAVCPMPQKRGTAVSNGVTLNYNWNYEAVPATSFTCAKLTSTYILKPSDPLPVKATGAPAADPLPPYFQINANGCATTERLTTSPACSPWRMINGFHLNAASRGYKFNVGSEVVSNFMANSTDLVVWRPVDSTLTVDSSGNAVDNTNANAAPSSISSTLDRILLSRCVDPVAQSTLPSTFAGVMALPRLVFVNNNWKCCNVSGYAADNPQNGFTNNSASCVDITSTDANGIVKLNQANYLPTVVMVTPDPSLVKIQYIPSVNDRQLVPGLGFFITFNDFANPTSYKVRSLVATNTCLTRFVNSNQQCDPFQMGTGWTSIASKFLSWSEVEVLEHRADILQSMSGSSFVRFGTRSQLGP